MGGPGFAVYIVGTGTRPLFILLRSWPGFCRRPPPGLILSHPAPGGEGAGDRPTGWPGLALLWPVGWGGGLAGAGPHPTHWPPPRAGRWPRLGWWRGRAGRGEGFFKLLFAKLFLPGLRITGGRCAEGALGVFVIDVKL